MILVYNSGKITVPVAMEKKPLSPPVGEESDVEFFEFVVEQLNNALDMLHIEVKTEPYVVLEYIKKMVEIRFNRLEQVYEGLRKTRYFRSASIQMVL
mgnify:CR=1 FL=1